MLQEKQSIRDTDPSVRKEISFKHLFYISNLQTSQIHLRSVVLQFKTRHMWLNSSRFQSVFIQTCWKPQTTSARNFHFA